MTDKIKCPDCGEEIEEVAIEQYATKTFRVDYESKRLNPVYPGEPWDVDDHAVRCPHCDTLNIDDLFVQYEIQEVVQ